MKTIAIIAMPGVQLLDVSGPLDVFAEANKQAGRSFYQLQVIASEYGHIRSSSGARLVADYVMLDAEARSLSIDTLLVAGNPEAGNTVPDPTIVDWLRTAAPKARRFGSVCSGAFFLAAAGLLDGHRVATHWAVAAKLSHDYPNVIVDEDAIHIRDGRVRTSAGVTAGLDLALSLVEEDLGRNIAKKVAGQLVMFFKRPGGQTQFSRGEEVAPSGHSALQELQRWIAANPTDDHSVAALSQRVGMSPRHFARVFRAEVGSTPAIWVETTRIAAARQLLETTHHAPKQIAASCGFSDAETFRRVFRRHAGVSPTEYRRTNGKLPE